MKLIWKFQGEGGTNQVAITINKVVKLSMLPSTKRPNEEDKRTFLILGMKAFLCRPQARPTNHVK